MKGLAIEWGDEQATQTMIILDRKRKCLGKTEAVLTSVAQLAGRCPAK